MRRFNRWLAIRITNSVGTMTCAWLFAIIGIMGVYGSLTGDVKMTLIVGSISGYFLQLVLLPIIMVGQKVQAEKTDAAVETVERVVEHQQHTHRLLGALHRHHGIELDEPAP